MVGFEIEPLQHWCAENRILRTVMSIFSTAGAEATEITVDDILDEIKRRGMHLLRREVTTSLRKLENMELGKLVTGRHGMQTRFVSPIGIVRLGRAALGEPVDSAAGGSPDFVCHRFAIRAGLEVTVTLPADLTRQEAERFARYINLLPFGTEVGEDI